jgi:hypothetical protein
MTAPWSIVITPIPKTEDCTIKVGEEIFTVRGLAFFADGGDQNLLAYFWNSPKVAATACVKSFAQAIRSENRQAVQFYKELLQAMCKVTGVGANETTAEDLLRRWEAQEKYDMAKKPAREFN